MWLNHWFEFELDYHLCDPVTHRRDTEYSLSSCFLRYRYRFYGRWKITAGWQSIPELVKIVFQISFKIRKRLLIYPSRTCIGFNKIKCACYLPFLDSKRFCLIYDFLLKLISWIIVKNSSTLPLRSMSITNTSSLLRATPSQYHASVLSYS